MNEIIDKVIAEMIGARIKRKISDNQIQEWIILLKGATYGASFINEEE